MVLRLTLMLACCFGTATAAMAQDYPPSRCLVMANAAPTTLPVRYVPLQAEGDMVRLRFVGHATFLIESPGGLTIATDYNGNVGQGVVPDVVTMNRGHSTHYTTKPDPKIAHVLPGWNSEGGPADHYVQIGDVLIRSVPSDIRGHGQGRIVDGNSIFIFEVANLCIGHLGHLHHTLSYSDLGWIGQLDIVMAPADGVYTSSHAAMAESVRVTGARMVLPMHYFSAGVLKSFLAHLDGYAVETSPEPEITVSAATLPDRPTVVVLPGY